MTKVTTGLRVDRRLEHPTRLQNAECRMLNSRFRARRGLPREKVGDARHPRGVLP